MDRLGLMCPGTETGDGIYKSTRQMLISNDFSCSAGGRPGSASIVRANFAIGGPRPGFSRIAGEEGDDQLAEVKHTIVEARGAHALITVTH